MGLAVHVRGAEACGEVRALRREVRGDPEEDIVQVREDADGGCIKPGRLRRCLEAHAHAVQRRRDGKGEERR